MDGWVDRWVEGWVDGWMGRWVDGWVDGWMDEWMEVRPILSQKQLLTFAWQDSQVNGVVRLGPSED